MSVHETMPIETAVSVLRPRVKVILGAAMLFAAAAVLSPVAFAKLTFLLVSAVLVLACVALCAGPYVARRWLMLRVGMPARLLQHDPAASFVTGLDGQILYANPASARVLGARRAVRCVM